MRISDWSSDVCSSDLASSRIPSGIGDALLNNERLVVVAFLTYCGLVTATFLKNHRIAVAVLVDFNLVKNCTGLRDKRFSTDALLRNVDFVGVCSSRDAALINVRGDSYTRVFTHSMVVAFVLRNGVTIVMGRNQSL